MKKILLLTIITLSYISVFAGSSNPEADKLFNQGKEKLKTLSRLEAKELFSQAIDLDAQFAEAYYERALIAKHFKEIDNAIADLEILLTFDNTLQTTAHLEIGKIKVKQEDFYVAIAHLDKILEKDAANSEALLLRGQCKLATKEYQDAMANFSSAVNNDSKNIDALYFKGLASTELKLYHDAITIFTEVIEKDKRYADAYFYRAYCNYELVVEIHEKHKKEHLTSAEADYTKALSLKPRLEEAYFDRGEVKMALKDYIGAIKDFKKAIELNPSDLEAHYQKAMCNYHYGYEEKAYKEFQQILKIDSMYANAHFQVGLYLYEIQEFDQAESAFTKLMSVEEEHADAHYWRGLSRIELGIFEGACEDLTRSANMGFEVEKTVYHAAQCAH